MSILFASTGSRRRGIGGDGTALRRPLALIGLGLAAFVISAWAGQAGPPTRIPVESAAATRQPPPSPEGLIIQGRGPSAVEALALATSRLPFTQTPGYLPLGYALAIAEARIESSGRAVLDVVYVGRGMQQLEFFQANGPNTKAIAAPVESDEQLAIGGRTWRYLLLAYPQPDGSRLRWHFLERSFDGVSYITLGLADDGDPVHDRAELARVAASLR